MGISLSGLLGAGGAGLGAAIQQRIAERLEGLQQNIENKVQDKIAHIADNIVAKTANIAGTGKIFSGKSSVLAISNEAFEILQKGNQNWQYRKEKNGEGNNTNNIENSAKVTDPIIAGNETKSNSSVYIIEDHLKIKTPRPNIDDTFFKDSYGAITGIVTTAAENQEKYYARFGDPLDRVLDHSYKLFKSTYDSYRDTLTRFRNEDTKEASLLSREKVLVIRLKQTHEKHEEHGIHEYANEVFAKRFRQETGRPVKLEKLYDKYGIDANNNDYMKDILAS